MLARSGALRLVVLQVAVLGAAAARQQSVELGMRLVMASMLARPGPRLWLTSAQRRSRFLVCGGMGAAEIGGKGCLI